MLGQNFCGYGYFHSLSYTKFLIFYTLHNFPLSHNKILIFFLSYPHSIIDFSHYSLISWHFFFSFRSLIYTLLLDSSIYKFFSWIFYIYIYIGNINIHIENISCTPYCKIIGCEYGRTRLSLYLN